MAKVMVALWMALACIDLAFAGTHSYAESAATNFAACAVGTNNGDVKRLSYTITTTCPVGWDGNSLSSVTANTTLATIVSSNTNGFDVIIGNPNQQSPNDFQAENRMACFNAIESHIADEIQEVTSNIATKFMEDCGSEETAKRWRRVAEKERAARMMRRMNRKSAARKLLQQGVVPNNGGAAQNSCAFGACQCLTRGQSCDTGGGGEQKTCVGAVSGIGRACPTGCTSLGCSAQAFSETVSGSTVGIEALRFSGTEVSTSTSNSQFTVSDIGCDADNSCTE